MLAMMARSWWVVAIRGIAAIAFGIFTIAVPGIALGVMIVFFGAYALVDGIFSIIAAVRGEPGTRGHGWAVVIMGVVSIIAGLVAFASPGLTALALLYIIGAWAIITGVMEIIAAIRLRREITGEWLMALAGVASVAFGVLLFIYPGAGILSVLLLVATFSIVFGAILLGLAWRLRKLNRGMAGVPGGAVSAG